MRTTVFLTLLSTCVANPLGREQSVAVAGRLMCGEVPAYDVRIKLYDNNFVLDSFLGSAYSNRNGIFQVTGHKRQITDLDPKVNIYHRCNYNGLCSQKISIGVPSSYVSNGGLPNRVFDLGTLNLAQQNYDQTTDCIH